MSLIDINTYGGARGPWVDEEECLPFPIFIAELELLVGNSKNGRPDGVQLLELLQKLVATIPRTDKAVLKLHQRQCESMLYDVLTHGIGAAVREATYTLPGVLSTATSVACNRRVQLQAAGTRHACTSAGECPVLTCNQQGAGVHATGPTLLASIGYPLHPAPT